MKGGVFVVNFSPWVRQEKDHVISIENSEVITCQ